MQSSRQCGLRTPSATAASPSPSTATSLVAAVSNNVNTISIDLVAHSPTTAQLVPSLQQFQKPRPAGSARSLSREPPPPRIHASTHATTNDTRRTELPVLVEPCGTQPRGMDGCRRLHNTTLLKASVLLSRSLCLTRCPFVDFSAQDRVPPRVGYSGVRVKIGATMALSYRSAMKNISMSQYLTVDTTKSRRMPPCR